ncbi:ECF transporter S component, partial [Staphylococcus aureus]
DQVANFTAGVLFILPVAFIFKKIKSAKGIVWSMFLGTVLMTVMMSILNYFLFLPAYTWFLNAPQLSDNMLKATITAG